MWHGSIRSPEIAEQAACYGDGFFHNHIFWPASHTQQMVDLYRQRFERYGHGSADEAIVGLGGQFFMRPNSQDPLFSYLHAVVVPTAVYAATDDFGHPGLEERVERAAGELAELLGKADDVRATGQSARRRRTVDDEFADPTPFEDLLKQAGGSPQGGRTRSGRGASATDA